MFGRVGADSLYHRSVDECSKNIFTKNEKKDIYLDESSPQFVHRTSRVGLLVTAFLDVRSITPDVWLLSIVNDEHCSCYFSNPTTGAHT